MPAVRGPLYLIAGGGESTRGGARRGPDPLLLAAVGRVGRPKPRVAYVGAASADSAPLSRKYSALLERAGAGSVTPAPLRGRRLGTAAAAAVIESADAVFFSGGDVEAGMRVLEERGMIPVLRAACRSGMPFIGVSAGSIMLCRSWIRWGDPGDDRSAGLFPCLGFAPIWCDTHGEGDGWVELKALLTRKPVGAAGYGIVSGSALMVEPGGVLSAAGGEVHVFRRRKAGVFQVQSLRPDH